MERCIQERSTVPMSPFSPVVQLCASPQNTFHDMTLPPPAMSHPDLPIPQTIERPGTPFMAMPHGRFREALESRWIMTPNGPAHYTVHWNEQMSTQYYLNDYCWPYEDNEYFTSDASGSENEDITTAISEDFGYSLEQIAISQRLEDIQAEERARYIAEQYEDLRSYFEDFFNSYLLPEQDGEEITYEALVEELDRLRDSREEDEFLHRISNYLCQHDLWRFGLEIVLWYATWRDGRVRGHVNLRMRMLGRRFTCDSCPYEYLTVA